MGLFDGISWVFDSKPKEEKTKEFDKEIFLSENWHRLSDKEKLDTLQEFSDSHAKSIGISNPPTVVSLHTDNKSDYGAYVGTTNRIKVNLLNCENPYEAMDTIVHENNHAYQTQCIENNNGKYSDEERTLMAAQMKHYYNSGDEYFVQAIELDSCNAGADYVLKHNDVYKKDPNYFSYLSDRKAEFESVGELLKEKTKFCNDSEMKQLDQAFFFGEISGTEYDKASAYIGENSGARKEYQSVSENITRAKIDLAMDSEVRDAYLAEYNKRNQALLESKYEKNETAKKLVENIKIEKDFSNSMEDALKESEQKYKAMRKEQADYIIGHNMGFREVENDENCKKMRKDLAEQEAKISKLKASMAIAENDNKVLEEAKRKAEERDTTQTEARSVSMKRDNEDKKTEDRSVALGRLRAEKGRDYSSSGHSAEKNSNGTVKSNDVKKEKGDNKELQENHGRGRR